MAIWQYALLALGVVWAAQSVGVWLQMRHYADVFKGITRKYHNGYVGAGHAPGRLRKGAIVMLVVDEDLVVRRLLMMSGRSVFAKFRRIADVEGLTLAQLRGLPSPAASVGEGKALIQALEQIDRVYNKSGRTGNEQEFAAA